MSISPTGNSQQVQIKPDKNALPAISTDAVNTDSGVQPTAPVQPTGSISQETESQTALISSQNTSETAEDADTSVEGAVEKLNSFMSSMNRDLEFEFDKDISRTIVTIRDTSTQEVVRVVPSEITVKLAKNLQENLEGDQKSVGQLLDIKT